MAQNGVQQSDVFNRFDVVSDSSDHYYFSINSNQAGNITSNVHKRIMREWKILEKDLPDSIYVRVYENRIDLLRAVIVGAAGTPYYDGIYFFDIAFPSDYPLRPPLVYYKSFGLRINPNLYANGRVCLSLINTWHGKRTEKWVPNESTILQVLVSIQALVLNEKPYFNEPGNGLWPGRVKKSNSYNEDVFILVCKTMLFTLRRAPKHFEVFVAKHFRERARDILSASKAYVTGGIRVGYYNCDGSRLASSSNSNNFKIFNSNSNNSGFENVSVNILSSNSGVSHKFRAIVMQLYPQLVGAFSRNGAKLGDLIELKVEQTTVSSKKVVVGKKKSKKSGVATRFMGKLKKILGLKEKNCVKEE